MKPQLISELETHIKTMGYTDFELMEWVRKLDLQIETLQQRRQAIQEIRVRRLTGGSP